MYVQVVSFIDRPNVNKMELKTIGHGCVLVVR